MRRREFLTLPAVLLANREGTPEEKPDIEQRLSDVEVIQFLQFYQMLYLLNLTRTRELNLPPIDRKGNNLYAPEPKEIT